MRFLKTTRKNKTDFKSKRCVSLRHRGAVQHRGDVDVLRREELLEGLLRRHLQRLHLQSVSRVEPGGR